MKWPYRELCLSGWGIEPKWASSVTLDFYDGNEETFTVSGILAGGEGSKQFSVFFSEAYAENGSQLKDMPYVTEEIEETESLNEREEE